MVRRVGVAFNQTKDQYMIRYFAPLAAFVAGGLMPTSAAVPVLMLLAAVTGWMAVYSP